MQVDRPEMPAGYGLKAVTEGRLIDWGWVEESLESARSYWVVTASQEAVPHAVPVWGVWARGSLYFSTDLHSKKGSNIATNDRVVVHLESGDEPVILEGTARHLASVGRTDELDEAYRNKYGYPFVGNPIFRFVPEKVMAWSESDFPESATRWRIAEDDTSGVE